MLLAKEFTVATLATAKPGSLLLPRGKYELAFLVGELDGSPMAVCLGGQYAFLTFKCSDAENWSGILVPDVQIEIDEKSVFDPQATIGHLGTLERIDTRLIIRAKFQDFSVRPEKITVESGLLPAQNLSAGFSKWRIVVGEGLNRRILSEIDTSQIGIG